MRFSEKWLRELVNPPVPGEKIVEQLTMAGLEVESVTSCRPDFCGVIIALIKQVLPHPGADNLKICHADIGKGKEIKIVCGASNVTAGNYYPAALPDTVLPGGKKIEISTIKGVTSEGMLCSEQELGLSENNDVLFELGQDASPGMDLTEYLVLDDSIIELSLTPNRGDCLSLSGIAREVAVLNRWAFEPDPVKPVAETINDARKIKLNAAGACPRYTGRVIKNVNIHKSAPVWLREKLRRSGIRSINVVVDITNFVMLELGQPMHAFDNDKLMGDIIVRYARNSEKLTLLDNETKELSSGTLVIADEKQAVAMAGIMGGLATSVTEQTQNIFLESAYFSQQAIAGRARHYGLHTDSSHRFERGVDYTLQKLAIERASDLILNLCGGEPGPVTDICAQDAIPGETVIALHHDEIVRLLGADIAPARVEEILQQLGFTLAAKGGYWEVHVPAYRFDVSIEADLIEEIARIYGYGNIPSTPPLTTMRIQADIDPACQFEDMMNILVHRGYYEAITYSFVDSNLQASLLGQDDGIRLLNPISSEMAVMRQSLWPGLLQALLYNVKRQQQRVRLFEYGRIYRRNDDLEQIPVLSGISYGNIYPEQWDIEGNLSDFYDMKADIEALLSTKEGQITKLGFNKIEHPALHPGQSAEIIYNDQRVGVLGALHPAHLQLLDIPHSVFLFELEMTLISVKKQVKFTKLSKYPSVRRDLAIVLDNDIPVINVVNHIKKATKEILNNLELFDVYRGEGIDLGKKSLALGLTFQRSSSTLIEEEIDTIIQNILTSLQQEFGATLRE